MGLVYAVASLGAILATLTAPYALKKFGVHKFLVFLIGLDALSVLTFTLSESGSLIVVSFILGMAINTLIVFALDELLKIFSDNAGLGGIRGTYLAIGSSAWVISQVLLFLSGNLALRAIYLIAFFIMAALFLLSLFALRKVPDPAYDRLKSLRYVRKFFKNKNLSRAYRINLILQFFFSIMVIYTPIYLSAHLGFSWREIGAIFAVMLLPFVILPFHVGRYEDKIGERRMLMLGFFIAGMASISLFFLEKPDLASWAIMLFLTRVGAATTEVSSDTYFFKHIKPENEEWIGVYRTAPGTAYILAPLAALLIFSLVPSFKFIFPLLGAVMFYGVYLSSTIKKSDI